MNEKSTSATEGMTHDYDKNAEYQKAAASMDARLLRDLVHATLNDRLRAAAKPLVLADYGCATGANSVSVLTSIAAVVRELEPDTDLSCLHNDLPSNDWAAFFEALRAATDSYLSWPSPPLPLVSARSFFQPCASAGSVTIGVSGSAAHWMSAQPDVVIPDGCYPPFATGNARSTLAAAAATDWRNFLASRAHDLAPGGRMRVVCLATQVLPDGTVQASASRLLRGMWEVIEAMVTDGLVTDEAAGSYVLAVYPRSEAEFLAPITDGPLDDEFEVISHEIRHVPSPYTAKFRQTGDHREYADSYVGFVRGFSESSLRDHLLDTELVDEFFSRLHARSEADPDKDAYDDCYAMNLVLRRRDTQ